ncbi:DUF3930 family protein [Ectobacillus funiculus]|uniref:DUF3930 family protein n=1 Tax=Ectobacillus funiculus TaxID=137993 RepID=UPI001FE34865|nr:DUF3930 family protein [Ectobacillus funiculus]
MEKNSMIDWKAEEDTSRLTVFANEHFDMWTDRMIKALVIFLTIVGIPFTIHVLLQFLFSL